MVRAPPQQKSRVETDFLRSGLESHVGLLDVGQRHPRWEGVSPFRPLPLQVFLMAIRGRQGLQSGVILYPKYNGNKLTFRNVESPQDPWGPRQKQTAGDNLMNH